MALLTLAFILGIVRRRDTPLYRRAAIPLFILLLFSAIAFPLYSYNKGPKDLRLSIAHREQMIAKENPPMLEIMKDIESMAKSPAPPVLLLHAGHDTWVLPILQIPLKQPAFQVIPAPEIDEQTLALAKQKAAGRAIYILVLKRQLAPDAARGLFLARKYTAQDCFLLALKEPQPQ